ncbi:MAG: hypothetical protein OXH10_00460 [bacterium]|nr:hypothetical protein [bacterium]MCY3652921.1 hypothetical protein [bacterium]
MMSHRKSSKVIVSSASNPYPKKADKISDRAEKDAGRNFGRIARTGILDQFVDRAGNRLLVGIPARYWRGFLKIFTETANEENIKTAWARFSEQV